MNKESDPYPEPYDMESIYHGPYFTIRERLYVRARSQVCGAKEFALRA